MATETKPESTAVAKRRPTEIERMITSEQARAYIEPFLPKGTDIQRVAATVMLAMQKDDTGTLRRCTPQSLVLGVARIMQWGLELGTTAYLLPFKNTDLTAKAAKANPKATAVYEATPVADYKGLAELMIASKAVRYIEPREVREGDKFEYSFGLNAQLVHQPFGGKSRLKAPITHVYCIIHLPNRDRTFDVMTAEQVEEIRQRYSKQWKGGPLPAWYAKKTIIRQVAKLLPKNPALAQFFSVLESDREVEIVEEAQLVASEVVADSDERPTPAEVEGDRGQDGEEQFLDDSWVEEHDRTTDRNA